MPKIELSEQEIQVLIAFLNRVNLTGKEVPAFNQITNKLNVQEDIQKEKKQPKTSN